MFDKMKQLMEMKKQAEIIKRELNEMDVESNEIDGIKIHIDGAQNFKSIRVDESFLSSGNKEQFENNLLTSVNAAIKKSQNVASQKMKEIMPGLPGI